LTRKLAASASARLPARRAPTNRSCASPRAAAICQAFSYAEAEAAQGLGEILRGLGEGSIVAGGLQALDFSVARELAQLAGGQLLAEEQRRGVGQLMRFVENDRIACRQQLGEPFVPQHDVGEEEVVVYDDDVRRQRVLAGIHHEALAVVRAFASEAVVARRGYLRPDGRGVGDVGELGLVAGRRAARECLDAFQVAHVGTRCKCSVDAGLPEVMMANVVRAPLEQRDGDGGGASREPEANRAEELVRNVLVLSR
jgi:hypothetical protein